MSHDATKALMGSVGSSLKKGVKEFASDPATFLAGLAVRLNSSGLLSVASGDGQWIGVSMGKSLSDDKQTSVIAAGCRVPVLLESEPARGSVVITSYANLVATSADTIQIGATTFTAQSSAVSHGGATFRAATSNAATAASLADQINNHATAGPLVYAAVDPGNSAKVLLTAKLNTSAGNSIGIVYTDNHSDIGATVSGATLSGGGNPSDFVSLGANVYFSNTTGKADDASSDSSISNAIYASGVLTGVQEDGTTAACAYVDMVGGL